VFSRNEQIALGIHLSHPRTRGRRREGPFGENLLGRFQSFQPRSPERKRRPLKRSFNSPTRSASASHVNPSPIKNHVINQLAYSRVHALPLSTIHSNLPAELRGAMAKPSDTEASEMLSSADLKTILDGISCVGEISREGKDAAGKLLESEFYYVPEMDGDSMRRETVTQSLGKTSIRAARKQHKVCCCRQCPSTHALYAYTRARSNTFGRSRATRRSARLLDITMSPMRDTPVSIPFLHGAGVEYSNATTTAFRLSLFSADRVAFPAHRIASLLSATRAGVRDVRRCGLFLLGAFSHGCGDGQHNDERRRVDVGGVELK